MDEHRKNAILLRQHCFARGSFCPLMKRMSRSPAQEYLTEQFRWRAVEQPHRFLETIDKRWPGETVGEPRS